MNDPYADYSFSDFVEREIEMGYCVFSYIGSECKCEGCERDRFNEQLIDDLVAAGVEF